MIRAHRDAKNNFIFRLRVNSFKEINKLLGLKIKRRKIVVEGVTLRIIKIWNPKTKQHDFFGTDLPQYWVEEHTIRSLYNLRWEAETAFLDLANTFKVEQWHSKFLNGILQELYATLWLYNYAKLQILASGQITKNPLDWVYEKPNFKLVVDWIIRKLNQIFQRIEDVHYTIQKLVIKSTQRRKRHSRSKPRVLKYALKRYPFENTVWVINGKQIVLTN